ncbi:MAG TPA: S8 family serine peptidase, partial [Nannocystaceae bacterium]|nr:S8 family serine peptidase [Nannocystaceae bacterium]
TAVAKMTDAGIPFVVAAGNASADACSYSPANVPDAITVGATDRDDKLASFSNTGSCVDVLAPGVSITSAWNSSNSDTNTIDGTSMAAPHVAGIVARYLEGHPSAAVDEIADAIISSATTGTATVPSGTTDRIAFASVEASAPAEPDGSGEECPQEWRGDGICDACLGDDPDCDGDQGGGTEGGTEDGGSEECPEEWRGDGICDVCLGDDPDCDEPEPDASGGEDPSCPPEYYDDGICDECLGNDPDCGVDPSDDCPAEYYGDGVCDECLGDDPDCDDGGGGEYCPDEWYGDGICDECLGDDPDC